jgi:hypothetical protein
VGFLLLLASLAEEGKGRRERREGAGESVVQDSDKEEEEGGGPRGQVGWAPCRAAALSRRTVREEEEKGKEKERSKGYGRSWDGLVWATA